MRGGQGEVREIGIYGGTFSPPHIGHVNAALTFYRQLGLDRLYIVPTSVPPHKRVSESDNPLQRLEMLKLAFEDLPEFDSGIFISDYEIEQSGKSYTVNTLEHFASLYPSPENRLTFLCGTDMFVTLARWYMPERIFELARIAFMRREARSAETDEIIAERSEYYRNNFNAEIVEITGRTVELSSSDVRCELAAGINGSDIPPKVMEYICANRLYTDAGK